MFVFDSGWKHEKSLLQNIVGKLDTYLIGVDKIKQIILEMIWCLDYRNELRWNLTHVNSILPIFWFCRVFIVPVVFLEIYYHLSFVFFSFKSQQLKKETLRVETFCSLK